MSSPMACVVCSAQVAEARCEQCGAAMRAGSYRVVKLLAQTPHSRMYVAEDEGGRRVALKELLFASVPSVQQYEAFEREGRLLQELDHPQVPRFFASFREGEGARMRLYLAQDLVQGESLWERLRAGAFDEGQARAVAKEVLQVLAYLHARSPKVIHRDVKPHNLIAKADGTILLVDFGAARELSDAVTHQATLVGTYGYMPPDQLAGTVDETSDLYALGATLMHLLTGRPPDKLMGDDLELGSGLSLNVSPAFDKFVRRLAAKQPAKRFPSAESAMEALRALPPLQAGASKRRKALIATAVAGAVLLAGGAAVVTAMRPSAPPPPARTEVRVYAWQPKVTLYEAANPGSALPSAAALPIGTELTADRDPASCGSDGFVQLFAPRAGYVKATDVRTVPPDYDRLMETARTALGEARLPDVETEGERARALRPKEREPLSLLSALYNAENRPDDARRIEGFLSELGPAPAPPPSKVEPRTGPPPAPGERWFVGASSLRMRKKPSVDARVVAEFPINTELEIVSVKDEWAQVKWTSTAPSTLEFSFDGASQAQTTERVFEGYVAQAYLVHDKLDKEWTVAKVDVAQKANDREEMVRQLARAAAIDPVDRPLQLQLAKVAVATRDYPIAARAAVAATELARGASEPLVELKLAYRCRGQRARAEWIADTIDPSHAPEDACIETLTPAECPPCDCGSADTEAASDDQNVPDPWQGYRQNEDKRASRLDSLNAAFPEGAWLRVRITGPSRPSPDAPRVIVYSLALDVEKNEEQVCQQVTPTVKAIDTVPVPAAGQDVTLWIQVPSYEGTFYGVSFAKRAGEVEAQLESSYTGCDSHWQAEPERSVHVEPSENRCEECQCT